MARLAGKARGQMRALEEQNERANPLSGRGAVPSSGLSQFRGGRRESSSEEEDEEMEGGFAGSGHVIGGGSELMELSAPKRGGRRRAAVRDKSGRAKQLGFKLSNHIAKMYGAGFWSDFGDGFKHGFNAVMKPAGAVAKAVLPVVLGPEGKIASGVIGALGYGHPRGGKSAKDAYELEGGSFWDDFKHGFNSVVAPVAGVAKSVLPMLGPEGMAASGVIGALGYGHGAHDEDDLEGAGFWDDFKSGFNSVVAPVAGVAKSVLPMMGPEGKMASGVIGALGYGHSHDLHSLRHGGATNSDTGAYNGHGRLGEDGHGIYHGGKPKAQRRRAQCRRAPAKANDGRLARAAIVKRVMAERGLKMIEASKYVKAHGLY